MTSRGELLVSPFFGLRIASNRIRVSEGVRESVLAESRFVRFALFRL